MQRVDLSVLAELETAVQEAVRGVTSIKDAERRIMDLLPEMATVSATPVVNNRLYVIVKHIGQAEGRWEMICNR